MSPLRRGFLRLGLYAVVPVSRCPRARAWSGDALLIVGSAVYLWDKSDTSARLNRARHAARFNRVVLLRGVGQSSALPMNLAADAVGSRFSHRKRAAPAQTTMAPKMFYRLERGPLCPLWLRSEIGPGATALLRGKPLIWVGGPPLNF